MGNCFSFDTDEPPQEDLEIRRERQRQAALQRQQQQESHGIKNPELLKAKQERKQEIEKKAELAGRGGGGLKWTVG